jgi:hypothetical protein
MNDAAEMRSGAMIYTSGFMKIGSDIQNLLGTVSQTARWFHKPTFIFK